jgi:serine/threonine protein kinase
MPLETLERNMYSIKSDSYALGVLIYYLIFKDYPFTGKDVSELASNIHKMQPNFTRNSFIP